MAVLVLCTKLYLHFLMPCLLHCLFTTCVSYHKYKLLANKQITEVNGGSCIVNGKQSPVYEGNNMDLIFSNKAIQYCMWLCWCMCMFVYQCMVEKQPNICIPPTLTSKVSIKTEYPKADLGIEGKVCHTSILFK